MATVDVVIPCYNYAHFLEASVRSALSQEGVALRVIIIDDASRDESAEVARSLAEQDSRVHLIALPRNVGMIPAINIARREARSEYFVKLDADDLLTPGSLNRSADFLDRHPNVGFVYGRPRLFSGDAPPQTGSGWSRWRVWTGNEWIRLRYQRALNCITQPEVMVRSATLREAGEYNARLPHTSDLEMWLRLAAISDVGRINGVVQGLYRVHANSMQRTVNSGPLKDLVGRREAFLGALSAMRVTAEERTSLELIVRRRLAELALDHICWTYDRDRTDPTVSEALVEFATATYANATKLTTWRALEDRRRSGRRSRWSARSLFSATVRRGVGEYMDLRRMMTGL